MPSKEQSALGSMSPTEAVRRVARAREVMLGEIHKVIIGQNEMIEQMLIAIFSRGHCLTIGVPGLAKTLAVSTLARALHLKFNRIQFTPDLMPSDITGTEIIEEDQASGRRNFRFVRGPVFSNIVLADEINRTPPKTQSALLQAMQEYQVTTGSKTYELDEPFFVMATQNPIEQEGTYPLPEAQLDRFMLSINIDYPERDEEREIVKATTRSSEPHVKQVLRARDILWIQKLVREVPVSDHVIDYAVDLARATRPAGEQAPDFVRDYLAWGAGPRAAQYLILGAKARAILMGRYSASCQDVRMMAHPVLRHRMFTNFNADAEGIDCEQIIDRLLESVAEPAYGESYSSYPPPPTQVHAASEQPNAAPHPVAPHVPHQPAGTPASPPQVRPVQQPPVGQAIPQPPVPPGDDPYRAAQQNPQSPVLPPQWPPGGSDGS